ncbi:MAG: ATP-binding protein, partial [Woeseia sp.]
GQELEVSLPDRPIWLNADPVRLAQVFGNLLSNSSKFSERGGRIHLSAVQQDDQVIVTVRDTGIGIPPGEIRAIFGMFAQVSSARERAQGGLGIGLTLVSRLVEMHGGSVEARSEGPGKGSEFVVSLPTLTGTHRDLSPERQEKPKANHERRILVVDDNRDTAASLAMLLQMSGNTTREAYDGLAAIETAAEFRPDIVLLDIGLPNLDGYEVCRRLRDKPWGRNVMIVALSGWGQDEDRRRSREAGFDHHLVKPVHYAALLKLFGDQKSSPAQGEMAG